MMLYYNTVNNKQKFLLVTAPIGIAVLVSIFNDPSRRILAASLFNSNIDLGSLKDFPDPGSMSETDFITASWKWVANNISYEFYGSSVDSVGELISCSKCYTPEEVIDKGSSNCVGKSVLLASILRTRLVPERVYMAIGDIVVENKKSGHAWVVVEKDNHWYVLEPTQQPGLDMSNIVYVPGTYVNDMYAITDDENILVAAGCGCRDS